MSDIKLSFVVNAYDRSHYLKNTLETIKRQITDDMEIIVVVDKTGQNMKDLAESYGASYYETILRFGDIGGPQNVGAKMAKGEWLFLTDQDCILHHDAVEIVLGHIKTKPYARLLVEWLNDSRIGYMEDENILNRFYKDNSHKRIKYGYEQLRNWGNAQIIRRDMFLGLGGFDERFRGYSEAERDFATRTELAGIRSFFIELILFHQWHPPRQWEQEFQTVPEFKEYWDNKMIKRIDIYSDNLLNNRVAVNEGIEWGVPAQL